MTVTEASPQSPLNDVNFAHLARLRGSSAKHARARYAFSAAIAVAPRLPATVTEVTEATEEEGEGEDHDDNEHAEEGARPGGWRVMTGGEAGFEVQQGWAACDAVAPASPPVLGLSTAATHDGGLYVHAPIDGPLAVISAGTCVGEQGGSDGLVQLDSHRATDETIAEWERQGSVAHYAAVAAPPSTAPADASVSSAGPDMGPPLPDPPLLPSSAAPSPVEPTAISLPARFRLPVSQPGLVCSSSVPSDGATAGAIVRPVSQRSLVRTVRSRGTMGGQSLRGAVFGSAQLAPDAGAAAVALGGDAAEVVDDWDGRVSPSRSSTRPSGRSVGEQVGSARVEEARGGAGGGASADWRDGVVRGGAAAAPPAATLLRLPKSRPVSPPVIEVLHDFLDELLQETPREVDEENVVRRATPPVGVQLSVGCMRLVLPPPVPAPPASSRAEPEGAEAHPSSPDALWSLLNGLLQDDEGEAGPPAPVMLQPASAAATDAASVAGSKLPSALLMLPRRLSPQRTPVGGASPQAWEAWGEVSAAHRLPSPQRTEMLERAAAESRSMTDISDAAATGHHSSRPRDDPAHVSPLVTPGHARRRHSSSASQLRSHSVSTNSPNSSSRSSPVIAVSEAPASAAAAAAAAAAHAAEDARDKATVAPPVDDSPLSSHARRPRVSRVRAWLLSSAASAWDSAPEVLAFIPGPGNPLLTGRAPQDTWATAARGPLGRPRPPGRLWIEELRGADSEREEDASPVDDGEGVEGDEQWTAHAQPGQLRRHPEDTAAAAPRFMRPTLSRRFLLHQHQLDAEGRRPAGGGITPPVTAGRGLRQTRSTPALLPLVSSQAEPPGVASHARGSARTRPFRPPRREGIQFVDWLGSLREEGEWGDPARRSHR